MEGIQNDMLAATDDFMAEQSLIENDVCLPLGNELLEDLFQPDKPTPLDDYSLNALNAWEQKLKELFDSPVNGVESDTPLNLNPTANSSDQVKMSITPGLVSLEFTSTVGEGSSQGGGNMSAVNPILSSQNIPNLLPVGPSAVNSITVESRTSNPQRIGASFGNSLTQCQPSLSPSLPVPGFGNDSDHGRGSVSNGHRQLEMTGNNPLDTPANAWEPYWVVPVPLRIQYNPTPLLPPSILEFQDFVEAWEGCLIGRIHSYRSSYNEAKALRRSTSPMTLTAEWSFRLEIAIFIPKNAVNFTNRICGGPIDYMFFVLSETNEVNLSDHMTSKNVCAKIRLPSQTVILSTTESKYHYIGSIFQGDAIFVEPV